VQRIANCSKIKNARLTPDKVWTFGYMDYSAVIKSNTLKNAWNGRNMWTVNNGWVVISVKYAVLSDCCKEYLTVTKFMTSVLLRTIEVMNTLVYGSFFCVIIYTSYILSKMVRIFMAWINWYFWGSMIYPNLCQEYLNMATFWILLLLLIKSSTFWYI